MRCTQSRRHRNSRHDLRASSPSPVWSPRVTPTKRWLACLDHCEDCRNLPHMGDAQTRCTFSCQSGARGRSPWARRCGRFQSGGARALVDWGLDREVSQPRGEFHQSNRRSTAPRMNADVLWSRTQGITRQQGLCRTEVEGSPWPSPNRSRRVDGERLRSSFSGRCGTTRRSTNGAAREAQLRRSSLIRRFVGHVRIGQPPNVT